MTSSPPAKKLLLHTSMLNNAIVMENLASSTGSNPERGKYLRRYTDVEAVDTVTRIAVTDLPWSYWSADRQAQENDKKFVEPDQWSRIRNGGILGYDSIYMVTDSSLSMMVHFTNEFMALNKITDTDFRVFMGRDRITSDVHIYDAHLDSADITCENGYVNMTEKPLAPLGNMAEVIRTNGRTNIFSHMLERFSVPLRTRPWDAFLHVSTPRSSRTPTRSTPSAITQTVPMVPPGWQTTSSAIPLPALPL